MTSFDRNDLEKERQALYDLRRRDSGLDYTRETRLAYLTLVLDAPARDTESLDELIQWMGQPEPLAPDLDTPRSCGKCATCSCNKPSNPR